ncbi:MAG: flavodoxin-dependent (E)-4-hydroxy-3-methylbut-2-enyl-diphosphate synthase [Holosporales bacterium]|jgi:(E)-4-hydroxy-3-methylbut-2-enyl-diphosphate synthase|nr:flavodoxin-dependent (E)-4-hydroxy-3-methylbut-2-enyl-diphosphate synthase [Holosporales bacterium]
MTKQITVGKLKIGGGAPIAVQTMTNTDTANVDATVGQVRVAAGAGCDLIRVSCPTRESTRALKEIIQQTTIPIVADIHFNCKRAIEAIEAGVHCIRINPGNLSQAAVVDIVKAAFQANGTAIRIGVNAGSLDGDIVERAVENCKLLEDMGFFNFKVSVKSSDVRTTIDAYRRLSRRIDYPLHVGVTESGTSFSGTIKSAIGIGSLLADGIGDTIRVSLAANILEEVRVGRQILKSVGLLKNCVNIVACPTCARTTIDVIGIASELEDYCASMAEPLKISVLGCVVNGIGEAKNSDIGVFGFRRDVAKIYVRGTEYAEVGNSEIVLAIKEIISSLKRTAAN